jgi:hypothetical protein
VVRVNISVPADLKRQMEELAAGVNWSAVACQAFRRVIAARGRLAAVCVTEDDGEADPLC